MLNTNLSQTTGSHAKPNHAIRQVNNDKPCDLTPCTLAPRLPDVCEKYIFCFFHSWANEKKKTLFLVRLMDRWVLLLSESYTILMAIPKKRISSSVILFQPLILQDSDLLPLPFLSHSRGWEEERPKEWYWTYSSLACMQTSTIYFVSNRKVKSANPFC